jgi:hypothetical protein
MTPAPKSDKIFKTILQAALICFLIFVASAIYVYMQFFPTPAILIIVAQFFWQASHGKYLAFPSEKKSQHPW